MEKAGHLLHGPMHFNGLAEKIPLHFRHDVLQGTMTGQDFLGIVASITRMTACDAGRQVLRGHKRVIVGNASFLGTVRLLGGLRLFEK